jgi:hypothetical protein
VVDYFLREERAVMRKLVAEVHDPATTYAITWIQAALAAASASRLSRSLKPSSRWTILSPAAKFYLTAALR